MAGEEVVEALGSEVDRLEKEIQKIVPGIRHVDIEAHNPKGPSAWSMASLGKHVFLVPFIFIYKFSW